MRVKLTETEESVATIPTLDELVPRYAMNKRELDSYKKICDTENAEIKKQMYESGITTYKTGEYTAKYIVSEKTSFNEDKLLSVMKKHNINVIRTREYVDMDLLENYLYHLDEEDEATKQLMDEIDLCRDVKQVVSLRVSS